MDKFFDYLPFTEEVQEAFENYNLEASSLTISALPKCMGSLIGRVVWRSPVLKVGKQNDQEALHFTLMDADSAEITGTAWGKVALKFDEILEKDKIYKFCNAVPIDKKVYQAVKNDPFESRVTKQSIELRFSGIIEPQLVGQSPFPYIDQTQCRDDFDKIKMGEVTSIVGLVNSQFLHEGNIYLCFANGQGYCIGVYFEPVKMEEIIAISIKLRSTVLGVIGVEKMKDVCTKTTGDKIPKALYKTFNDTLLIKEPLCEGAKNLVTWRDELPDHKNEGMEQEVAL